MSRAAVRLFCWWKPDDLIYRLHNRRPWQLEVRVKLLLASANVLDLYRLGSGGKPGSRNKVTAKGTAPMQSCGHYLADKCTDLRTMQDYVGTETPSTRRTIPALPDIVSRGSGNSPRPLN